MMPSTTLYLRCSLALCDQFQRATTGYHTLAHCGWTLARQGEPCTEMVVGADTTPGVDLLITCEVR